MTIQEFTERTGFTPTTECYEKFIEPQYLASILDKDAWCKDWKKHNGIAQAYAWEVANYDKKRNAIWNKVHEKEDIIGMLQADLDAVDIRKKQVAYFLIEQAVLLNAYELRDKAIELIGEKAYLSYKVEHGLNIWEPDRDLLIKYLQ